MTQGRRPDVRPQDRARGALYGLAIGDALGMPTQMLSRRQIVDRWGPLLTGFEAAPGDHPIAAGMPAGAVTDDTEQAVLLGRLLVGGQGRGDPGELAAARLGAQRGHWTAGADVAARIDWAATLVADATPPRAAEVIYTLVGTSLATQESVPAAFAVLSAVPGDPWQACLLAASLGGDCDTIAAMAGAVGGACHGLAAFPPDAIETIDGNGLDLAELADSLYQLRKS